MVWLKSFIVLLVDIFVEGFLLGKFIEINNRDVLFDS